MGILNVTPDSFSDGGRYYDAGQAVARAEEMIAEGADLIDVGGESTRPNAVPVDEAEERRRVLPVIAALSARTGVPISIDTQKPGVALAALGAGAAVVNDVGASRNGRAMWRAVADTGAGYVCMHSQGTPATMQQNPVYEDVVREVSEFFGERLRSLTGEGVSPAQVVLDVGIGFGKLIEHNLALLAKLGCFSIHQRPLLLGVSRKSFIGKLLGAETEDRLAGSLACAAWAVMAGVQLLRVHDVAATKQAVRMIEALQLRAR